MLCFGLSGCATDRTLFEKPRPPVAFEMEPWATRTGEGRRIVSEHYEIYTTLRDEYLLSTFPELMETAFDFFRSLVPPSSEPEERMKVYLFGTRNEWAAFTRAYTGARAPEFLRITNGGYSERGVTVIQYVSHQTTFPIMAHEGFHQYLYHHVNRWVPAWLNEGMATLCEGQRWQGIRIQQFDPWHNPVRRNALAEALVADELFSLSELLETNAGRVINLSSRAVSTYYAQLWGLMLFLREGAEGKYAAGMDKLLRNLGSSSGPAYVSLSTALVEPPVRSRGAAESLFRNFISTDLETFEAEYRAFLREHVLVR